MCPSQGRCSWTEPYRLTCLAALAHCPDMSIWQCGRNRFLSHSAFYRGLQYGNCSSFSDRGKSRFCSPFCALSRSLSPNEWMRWEEGPGHLPFSPVRAVLSARSLHSSLPQWGKGKRPEVQRVKFNSKQKY